MNPLCIRSLSRPPSFLAFAIAGSLFAAAHPTSAASPTITFRLAADTATAIPGGTGNFATFFSPTDLAHPPGPCISFGTVAFFGAGTGQQGIYMIPPGPPGSPQIPPGPPNRVADLGSAIPGGTGNFTSFSTQPSIGPVAGCPGGCTKTVAVLGYGESGQQGIYMIPPGPPCKMADVSTAIPGGSGNFVAFAPQPAIGEAPSCPGGCAKTVVALGYGESGQQGLYMYPPGPPIMIADKSTAMPGSLGQTFASFGPPAFDGRYVAFAGASPLTVDGGLSGVYKSIPPGPPGRVADSNTPVPAGFGNFQGFGAVAVDPGVVVFEGYSKDPNGNLVLGLYTDSGGVLTKIVAVGDALQGRTLSELHFGPNGFSNGEVAFAATFSDGSQSITAAALNAQPAAALCPLGQGYWKNHASAWPVASLKLGSQTYAKADLLLLLGTPVKGDASLILGRQLVATLLDLANGSLAGHVGSVVADAQARLGTFAGRLPYGVRVASASGAALSVDGVLLAIYNSGALTGGCTEHGEDGDD
jgi:hypothetical protein